MTSVKCRPPELQLTLELMSRRNGKIHTQEYARGVPLAAMEVQKADKRRTGTLVSFLPDSTIFEAKCELVWAISELKPSCMPAL